MNDKEFIVGFMSALILELVVECINLIKRIIKDKDNKDVSNRT